MKKDIVISLCDYTGIFTKPWRDAGYKAIHIDPQREDNGTILEMMPEIREAILSGRVAFVAGFPPCTDLAVSGARWFKEKAEKDKHFQVRAVMVVEQCRMIGELSGAPWFVENPIGVLSTIIGKPDFIFHPWQYSGYCESDNYTKATCLWTGGGFVMPEPFHADDVKPDDRIHKCAPGPDRVNIRSATPEGFSKAVFLTNS